MNSEEFVKKVYVSENEGLNRRGRPLRRWEDGVKEYMNERGATRGGGIEQERRQCFGREGWRLFCRGHPLGNVPRGNDRGVRAIDRQIDTELRPHRP